MTGNPDAAKQLFERLAAELLDDPRVSEQKMLHAPSLAVDGKNFAFLGMQHRMIVKLPADRVAELISADAAEPLVMRGSAMKEWAALPHNGDAEQRWPEIVRDALDFVAELPATAKQQERGRNSTR